MAYDAIRTCLLEVSEAAVKLGTTAETLAPEMPWKDIRSLGNYLRHRYDDLDLAAIEQAVHDLDRLEAACEHALARLASNR
jgi:uncharacterized protein with HEPN domain